MTAPTQSFMVLLAIAVASLSNQSRAALAAKPLGAHAIHAALAKNTLSIATANGSTAQVYLARHNTLRGTFGGKKVKGRWSIKGNKLCLRFPQKRDSGCWNVLRYQDGRLQLFNATGTPAGDLAVSKGNPRNF
jgi:hypothetical protein